MRKLDRIYTNPIDNVLLDIGDILTDMFHELGLTPNNITTLSLLFSLVSLYYWYYVQPFMTAIMFMISYLFDALDGYYARKYNMTSPFGDCYDHSVDLFKITTFGSIIVYDLLQSSRYMLLLLLAINGFLNGIFAGCQEKLYNNKKESIESPALIFTYYFCPTDNIDDIKKYLKFFRYFGDGTLFTYMSILLAIQ